MNRDGKSRWNFWCFLLNFQRYSLTFCLVVVLLYDSAGATPLTRGLLLGQQLPTTQQGANPTAAQQAFQDGFQLYEQGTAESLRKAILKLEEALQLWQQVDNKDREANTLYYIGNIYEDLEEYQKALEYYNQALPLVQAVGDREGKVAILNNLGLVYSTLGEKQKALECYKQALPLVQAVGDREKKASLLANIGLVYSDLKEYQKALEYCNQSLSLVEAFGKRSWNAEALNTIGMIYSDLGEMQKALEYLNQSLSLHRAVGDRTGEATALNEIGLVYSELGENQKAPKYLYQSLSLHRAVGDRTGEAATLSNIALVYTNLEEYQKALECYKQALSLDRGVGKKEGEATILSNIGSVYGSLGQKQEALKYFNLALPLHRAVGNKSGEAHTLSNIAHLERSRGNLEQSLQQIEAAIKIIKDLRIKVDNSDLRTSYFASVQGDYKFYIDLLMQLHKKNPSMGYAVKALNASEKSRARGLLELLTEARANIRKGASPELLNAEKQLTAKIDALEKQRFEIVNSDKINDPVSKALAEDLSKQISKLQNEYQQLQDEIKKSNPQYASLKYPEPLTLPQIQQQLDKDTLLLQYSLGKEHSYLWAVSSNSVDSYELPKQAQIEKAAINLFCLTSHSISKPPTAPGRENPCKDIETRSVDVAATELSQMILAPVKQKLGQKRLVIVADGALQYIPFAALASPSGEKQGKQGDNRGGINVEKNDVSPSLDSNYEPLLVEHEIINLPSASTIAIQRQQIAQRKKAPKTLAILADPVFEPEDERVTGKPKNSPLPPNLELERAALARSANLLNRFAWNRLGGTRVEAESILKLVPSSTERLQVFDFDANYTWATSSALNQFRILHFATHGFVNDENPELSGIVLSLVDKQGKDIQGYLRLNELFNLDYPADLIVLSACETGLGKNIQGEGLVGLTRGLMYAGGERLVVSLWRVSDEGTPMLMQEFYKEMLLNGKSPNTALRAAQLKMWKQQQWRDPYNWAAFTFLGEWR